MNPFSQPQGPSSDFARILLFLLGLLSLGAAALAARMAFKFGGARDWGELALFTTNGVTFVIMAWRNR